MTISGSLPAPAPTSQAGNPLSASPSDARTCSEALATGAAIADYIDEKTSPEAEPAAADCNGFPEKRWARDAARQFKKRGLFEHAIAYYRNANPCLSRVDAKAVFAAALADSVRRSPSEPLDYEFPRLRKVLKDTGILDAVCREAFADSRALIRRGAELFNFNYELWVHQVRAANRGMTYHEAEKAIVDSVSIDAFMQNLPRMKTGCRTSSGKLAGSADDSQAATTEPTSTLIEA